MPQSRPSRSPAPGLSLGLSRVPAFATTLLPPSTPGAPVRVKIVLDTHSGALPGIALDQAVALRTDGADVPPTAVEQATGGGHHREACWCSPLRARPVASTSW